MQKLSTTEMCVKMSKIMRQEFGTPVELCILTADYAEKFKRIMRYIFRCFNLQVSLCVWFV